MMQSLKSAAAVALLPRNTAVPRMPQNHDAPIAGVPRSRAPRARPCRTPARQPSRGDRMEGLSLSSQ